MEAKSLWTVGRLWNQPLVRLLLGLTLLGASVGVIQRYWNIFFPLIVGLLLAYLTEPLAKRLQRGLRLPAVIAAGLIVVTVMGTFVILGLWLAPILIGQMELFAQKLPAYLRVFMEWAELDLRGWVMPGRLGGMLSKFQSELMRSASGVWDFLKNLFFKASHLLFTLTTIPIFWMIFILELEKIKALIIKYTPRSKRSLVYEVGRQVDLVFSGFFRGRLVIAVLVGAMLSFGWWWADVPYWFLLGMITGLLNIVPYASALSWPMAILLKYFENQPGENYTFLTIIVWPSLVFGLAQFVDGWVLTPWIQGDTLNLNPGMVIVAAMLGGAVGGLFGLLLAIPVAAAIKVILSLCVLPYWEAWAEKN